VGLQELAYRGESLPDEVRGFSCRWEFLKEGADDQQLQEFVTIAAASLSGELAPEDREIALDELEGFKVYFHLLHTCPDISGLANPLMKENVTAVAQALSKQLHQNSTRLASVLSPDSPTPVEELPSRIHQLQENIAISRSQLATSRTNLATQMSDLHTLHRQVLESCIRILEQTIHGSVARGTKAKADYLVLVAEGMSKKLGVQYAKLVQQVYSPETQKALKTKAQDLEAEILSTKRKVRDAAEKLEQYEKVRGMEGIVREYAEIIRECERVGAEVGRLEGR
jgi:hypothetical protein